MKGFEDSYLDIIKKAAVGSGFGEKKISELSSLPLNKVQDLFKGNYCSETLKLISKILNLDYNALKAHADGNSHPPKIFLDGLFKFESSFAYNQNDNYSVNHYLLVDNHTQTALLFDTGTNAKETLEYLQKNSLKLESIFITHQHKDHILALNQFTDIYPNVEIHAAKKSRNSCYLFNQIQVNKTLQYGAFTIKAYATPGHTEDGISFKVEGLSRTVMFVGDALLHILKEVFTIKNHIRPHFP